MQSVCFRTWIGQSHCCCTVNHAEVKICFYPDVIFIYVSKNIDMAITYAVKPSLFAEFLEQIVYVCRRGQLSKLSQLCSNFKKSFKPNPKEFVGGAIILK